MAHHVHLWVEEKKLGKGGFGNVTLYKNKESGEKLALKECRNPDDMTERQKERWQQECRIMICLKHENIVRGLKCPAEIDRGVKGIPVMAMEYCDSGDMRKVLIKAENCCGLPEYQVRGVAHDVCNAVEYLHNQNIMHRDLKPENIVLHPGEKRMQYKLIDLGYAKLLDHDNVCQTIVGTSQYLAPELMMNQQYKSSVDFWCLGLTIFECITGFRPFFHGEQPMRWMQYVHKKRAKDIHGYFDAKGSPTLSNGLPTPNQLCKHTQGFFESWLRLMLLYDPKHRGGGTTNPGNRPLCFQQLQDILTTKVLHFYIVPTNQMLSYSLQAQGPGCLLQNILKSLEKDCQIAPGNQELLLASGVAPDPNKPAEQYWSEQEPESCVYVFDRSSTAYCPDKIQVRSLPKHLQHMVHKPIEIKDPEMQKRAWANAVGYSMALSRDYQRLMESNKAANVCLLRDKTSLGQAQKQVLRYAHSLHAYIDFFKSSFQFDLARLAEQKGNAQRVQKLQALWQQTKIEVDQLSQLVLEAEQFEQRCMSLDTKVFELQRAARVSMANPISKIDKKVETLHEEMINTPRDKRHQKFENGMMVTLVQQCLKCYQENTSNLHAHVSKIQKYKMDTMILRQRASSLLQGIIQSKDRVCNFQTQRQKDIWNLSNHGQPIPGAMPREPHSSLSTSASSDSISMKSLQLVDMTLSESTALKHCSYNTAHELEKAMASLTDDSQTANLTSSMQDWSFVNGSPPHHSQARVSPRAGVESLHNSMQHYRRAASASPKSTEAPVPFQKYAALREVASQESSSTMTSHNVPPYNNAMLAGGGDSALQGTLPPSYPGASNIAWGAGTYRYHPNSQTPQTIVPMTSHSYTAHAQYMPAFSRPNSNTPASRQDMNQHPYDPRGGPSVSQSQTTLYPPVNRNDGTSPMNAISPIPGTVINETYDGSNFAEPPSLLENVDRFLPPNAGMYGNSPSAAS